jgi:hypothetical protein
VRAGGSFVEQVLRQNSSAIYSDEDADGKRLITGQNITPGKTCEPGSLSTSLGPYSCDWHQYQRLTRTLSSYGAGEAGSVDVQQEFLVELLRNQGPTVRARTERCIGASCGDAVARTWSWEWAGSGTQGDQVTINELGPRGSFTTYASTRP